MKRRVFARLLPAWCASVPLAIAALGWAQAPESSGSRASDSSVPPHTVPSQTAEVLSSKTNPASLTPEEFFRSLARLIKADWAGKLRAPANTISGSRPQIALALGIAFADGYLALQAEDAHQCRHLGKDLLSLAKTLGVQGQLLDHCRSLSESSQKRDWTTLRRELELTQSDVDTALHSHEDGDLARLVSLGAWIRSTQVVASILCEQYSEGGAQLLRHPALRDLLSDEFAPTSVKLRDDPIFQVVRERLAQANHLLRASSTLPPSQEDVQNLSSLLGALLQEVTSKRN